MHLPRIIQKNNLESTQTETVNIMYEVIHSILWEVSSKFFLHIYQLRYLFTLFTFTIPQTNSPN